MRAHLIQLDIAWESKQANYDKVERLLSRAGPEAGDLVVLPEMFDTGFSFNVESTSDRDNATLNYLLQLAGDLGVYVQGARTVSSGAALAENRATVVSPAGQVLADYAKVHPFSYGREQERFEGGRSVVVYRCGDGDSSPPAPVVCPAICYDLRFPELFRLGLFQGAEVFAIGANWPEARQHHWRALLIARAIENQAIVLGVNRTGRDPNLNYVGGSIAVGPRGDILGELQGGEGVLSVALDARDVRSWREKFPAWKDVKLMPRPAASVSKDG
jgi:predicted amidohydrolase